MTNSNAIEKEERWRRPSLDRESPVRSVGGVYRTADDKPAGIAGVPLNVPEDAVIAAVRMAYKVAQSQVERSSRLAKRLRVAGARAAGPRSERQAVDATEELVSRAVMAALTWLEGLGAEGDSPLKRLMLAQYRLIGSTLGLTLPEGARPLSTSIAEAALREARSAVTTESAPSKSYAPPGVKVVLKTKGRPVRVCHLDVATAPPLAPTQIDFYSATHIESDPVEAMIAIDAEGRRHSTLSPQRPASPGRWRAAICQPASGEQIGVIEIEM